MDGMLSDFSDFLFRLYRRAEEQAPGEFQEATLADLSGLFPVDCAAWGGGFAAQRAITDLVVWNEDDRILTDWHQVREVDPLCDHNLRHPGHMHHIDDLPEYRQSLAFNEHWRRHDIHQLMATIVNEPQSNYVSFIALCHTDPKRPFQDAERDLSQALLPHLVQAQRQNQRIYLEQSAKPSEAVALVSACGLVRSAHPAFDELSRSLWQQSSRIPDPVMAELRDAGQWRTPEAEVVAQALGYGYLIRIAVGAPVARLSAREREVAEMYVQGLTYKEIAGYLDRSPATIRNLIARCYQKLKVHDKVSLIRRLAE
ncbi:helix-turn-helix transcriptional regulator [Saccharospirillum salsuginis]|uniref:HTH luxR-type domain-containing protein n=1 Tax=Saccharospirillum salsuginis TaxID=418750 RepID=A0A918KL72_9GAMM|nr:LuxR C-terminal-related transcriptional regulator [Saccharospirillum salsuginis]GGX66671.1 hypothetical protein GCM10007392_38020 [Saccharospirillum salsuginis]